MSKTSSKIKKEHIALAIIIVLQVLTVFFVFKTQKKSYDTDEFYSYGLANSYKKPFLYLTEEETNAFANATSHVPTRWFTGDDFKYYLRTNDETAFCYDSVYYNQVHDTIPPLYYSVLHTICSVRSGHFSWYYALWINLFCLVITQIFTYLLAARLTRSKLAALLVVAFWGFTLGGISCFIFLRMYAMLTMFGVIYSYLTVKLHTTEKPVFKGYAMIALTAFLGALVHHNFLIFAFFCTAFSCIFLLMQKSIKKFFSYGFSALAGIALSVAVFPATIKHLTLDIPWSDSLPFWTSLRYFTITLKNSFTGSLALHTEWTLYVRVAIIPLILFSLPILFLFRDKPFVKNLPKNAKKLAKAIWSRLSDPDKMNPGYLIILLTVISYLSVIASKTFFMDLWENSIRYLYILIPGTIIVLFGIVLWIIRKFKKELVKKICSVICSVGLVGLLVYQHNASEIVYLYKDSYDVAPVSDFTKERDCILLVGKSVNLQCCSLMLEDAKNVLCSDANPNSIRYYEFLAEYNKIIDKHEPFMLLLDVSDYLSSEEMDAYKEAQKEKKKKETNGEDTKVSLFTDSDYSNILHQVDIDDRLTEDSTIKFLEKHSGYKASKCCSEQSCGVSIAAYLFEPQK
ncbi:MAG: MFS transporter [Ruminococcus sp.]|uniref:hypothetical protein n=1 Tax=Ruminococcus sp. TaxID=41978 RepID=UPI0025CD00C2|nr:hypothetical protein [Ruminococcus sp.]MCR5601186.1 MFS transporter [Ruminococcus sp.]